MKTRSLIAATSALLLMSASAMAAELKIGLGSDADVLDPAQSRTFVGRIVYTAMCDKLVDVSPDLKIVPQLATEWTWSDDGKELTMKLREGVKFHDGTPFNAEAVVATIDRNINLPESRRKSELSSVEKVEAIGENEVKFKLKSADVTLLAQLADRAGMMVSPKAAKELGANFGSHPVCAGPFKFVERVQQDRIVLEKFQDYWNKDNVFLDKVTYLPIPDTTVRLANLRSGDLDMGEEMAPSDAAAIKADTNLAYVDAVNLGYHGTVCQCRKRPGSRQSVRQGQAPAPGLSLAIDREAIIQIVYEGTGLPGNQPFPPTSPWYNKEIPVPARDVEKAKALLKEAGFERFKLDVSVTNNPVILQMAQVIQSMVAEAGFDVSLKATEFATLLDEQTAGKYRWRAPTGPAASIRTATSISSSPARAASTTRKYCNPEVDKLLNEARGSTDDAVRKQKYDAAHGDPEGRAADHLSRPPALDLGPQQEGDRLCADSRRHDPARRASRRPTDRERRPRGESTPRGRLDPEHAHVHLHRQTIADRDTDRADHFGVRLLAAEAAARRSRSAMAGEERDPQVLAYLREKYRLNDPVPIQYFHWLGGVLQGDLGISLRTNMPVTELIAEKLPVTIQLAIMAMIFAFAIGIPMGILAAVKKEHRLDYLANVVALSGLSIPNFWLGIMLILLVSVRLGWLPASGYEPFFADPVRSLQTMIMPAFVLGNALAATLMRHTRSRHARRAQRRLHPHRARQGACRAGGRSEAQPSQRAPADRDA